VKVHDASGQPCACGDPRECRVREAALRDRVDGRGDELLAASSLSLRSAERHGPELALEHAASQLLVVETQWKNRIPFYYKKLEYLVS
jgi:hypothetical protein